RIVVDAVLARASPLGAVVRASPGAGRESRRRELARRIGDERVDLPLDRAGVARRAARGLRLGLREGPGHLGAAGGHLQRIGSDALLRRARLELQAARGV